MKHISTVALFLALCLSSCGLDEPDASSIIAELDATLPGVVRDGLAPSVQVAVFHGDSVIWSRAMGDSTSRRHAYMIASVQKVVTAVAVLKLAEHGRLRLDDDVSGYLPFTLRHPDFPDIPITVRMLLAHRSGLGDARYQFGRDTRAVFAPRYRPSPPQHLMQMSQGEFMAASLLPGGDNYDGKIWRSRPGTRYFYSVTAYPLLGLVVDSAAGMPYQEYVREQIFSPLAMQNSGFTVAELQGRHAMPYVREDGKNVRLPLYDGHGRFMRSTAEDMSRFFLALQNDGRHGDVQLLSEPSVQLMREATTEYRVLFRKSEEMQRSGHGLGLHPFRGGWFGYGGSAPGYECLARYHPSRGVGYVIHCNVNAILSGGDNYASARKDLYDVQEAVLGILDPWYHLRVRLPEMLVVLAVLSLAVVLFLVSRRKARRRNSPAQA